MLSFHFFNAVYVLLGITSAISASSFPHVENPSPFSITPQFIYLTSKPSAVFSGYSYATQDFNGAASNVIFMTGPDSAKNVKMGINSIYKPAATDSIEYEQMDAKNVPEESVTPSKTKDMESEKKNQMDSDIRSPAEQANQFKEMKDDENMAGREETMLPLEHPVTAKIPHYPTVPNFYIVPAPLRAPQYSINPYTPIGVPTYGLNNPFVRIFYQPSFISPISPHQLPLATNKDLYYIPNAINDEKVHTKGSKSDANNLISTNKKTTTPASEVVTDPIKNMSINVTSTAPNVTNSTKTSEELKSSSALPALNATSTTEMSKTM